MAIRSGRARRVGRGGWSRTRGLERSSSSTRCLDKTGTLTEGSPRGGDRSRPGVAAPMTPFCESQGTGTGHEPSAAANRPRAKGRACPSRRRPSNPHGSGHGRWRRSVVLACGDDARARHRGRMPTRARRQRAARTSFRLDRRTARAVIAVADPSKRRRAMRSTHCAGMAPRHHACGDARDTAQPWEPARVRAGHHPKSSPAERDVACLRGGGATVAMRGTGIRRPALARLRRHRHGTGRISRCRSRHHLVNGDCAPCRAAASARDDGTFDESSWRSPTTPYSCRSPLAVLYRYSCAGEADLGERGDDVSLALVSSTRCGYEGLVCRGVGLCRWRWGLALAVAVGVWR